MTISSGHVSRNVARKPSCQISTGQIGEEAPRFGGGGGKIGACGKFETCGDIGAGGKFDACGDCRGGLSNGAGLLSELSEGMGDAAGRSAAKLFLVVIGDGTSGRATTMWEGVVRCPRAVATTVKHIVLSNKDGVKRDDYHHSGYPWKFRYSKESACQAVWGLWHHPQEGELGVRWMPE